MTLLDCLVFKGDSALSNLLTMGILDQGASIVLSPFAGFWMKRYGGRKWLVSVNLASVLTAFCLIPAVSRTSVLSLYLAFIVASLFFYIGRLYITPMVVSKDQIISFNSLNERISLAGGVCGPWIIGSIVLSAGREIALIISGVIYFLAALASNGLHLCEDRCLESNRVDENIKTYFRGYAEPFKVSPVLKWHFATFGVVLVGGGALNFGFPILLKDRFGTIADWGILMSGFTGGSCLATFLLPKCSVIWRREVLLSLALFASGGAMVILWQFSYLTYMFIPMILLGVGFSLLHILLESLVQQDSIGSLSKTMPMIAAFKGLCYLAVMLFSAVMLTTWGPQILFVLGAVLFLFTSLLIAGRQFTTTG